MRRPALIALALTASLLALTGGVASGGSEPTETPAPSATPSPEPSPDPTASPAPTPIEPTAPAPIETPAPTPVHSGPIKPGDWVQIMGEGCLNARTRPGLAPQYPEEIPEDTILNCLPEGFIGRIESSGPDKVPQPVVLDGHTWWYMVGQGWLSEQWLAFHHEGGAFWRPRADLAGAGLIAYFSADNNVWLMNADGSDQRMLTQGSGANGWVDYLSWSPTGQQLSFTISTHGDTTSVITRIVDLNGAVVADLAALTAVSWSPDGGRLAGIRFEEAGGLGGQRGVPVVRDFLTGVETVIGPSNWYGPGPAWSPDGSELAFYCSSLAGSVQLPDGTWQDTLVDCITENGLQVVSADGAHRRTIIPLPIRDDPGPYYGAFSWSPAGDSIAVSTSPGANGEGCRGYTLVDVSAGAHVACVLVPSEANGFQCGFSAESGASDWTPDARYLLHHGQFGGGRNGIWIVEVATGAETLIPIVPVESIDVALSGQQLAFDSAGDIWIANTDGTGAAPIADGRSPLWQPL